MVRVTLDLTGKDATFLSNCYRYHSGLSVLPLYRTPPDGLGTDKVKEKIDTMQHAYEGGTTGNRVEIAIRKKARKEVIEMFRKIISYCQSIATEDDIPALIQAGFQVLHFGGRKRPAAEPAV